MECRRGEYPLSVHAPWHAAIEEEDDLRMACSLTGLPHRRQQIYAWWALAATHPHWSNMAIAHWVDVDDSVVLIVSERHNHADLGGIRERVPPQVLLHLEAADWPVVACFAPYNARP